MKALILATHAERFLQYLSKTLTDSRVGITTVDEEAAASVAELLTNLQAATDDFLGNHHEKDIPQ